MLGEEDRFSVISGLFDSKAGEIVENHKTNVYNLSRARSAKIV